MQKKIGTDDLRKKMGEILDCVNLRDDEFIIHRKQKPIAALVPLTKLAAMTKMAKGYVLEHISGKSIDISQEEADVLANEAKHLSRKSKQPKRKTKCSSLKKTDENSRCS